MELEQFYGMNYKGARRMNQWDAPAANYTDFGANGNSFGVADDHLAHGVDLNEQLIRNKPATFFMRVSGDAMTGAGIFSGDVVIVDRSVKAVSGKVVIAILNGEMLIRRLEKTFNKLRLVPETSRLAAIDVDISGAEFSIWGVVTYVIHAL
ncbi:MAG TPA: translesion error-prone DNA polymerase V autoproteolytic subunit [Puia sp.]|nr:translesion error-prone DNA polymerase V autoproteolytic subunit [Puia sp.]